MRTSEEDYIKLIYELSAKTTEEFIKTTEIVANFGYTTQSVLEMIKKLEERILLVYIPYKGVKLTKLGETEAIRMVRAHRIWEVFLAQELGLDWSLIHQEAENLEHSTSNLVIEKLYNYLEKPKYCTQGNPIPDLDGNIEAVTYNSLLNANVGAIVKIKRVTDYRPLLAYMEKEKIKLLDVFTVSKRDDFNQIFVLQRSNGESITISYAAANMVYI